MNTGQVLFPFVKISLWHAFISVNKMLPVKDARVKKKRGGGGEIK